MQKLGVLGGTFDPIHEGHIALAREALREGGLDGIVLLPMARPAHREADASAADRFNMCKLAVEGEEGIYVSQAGMASGVRYTTDTLGPLRKEFPDASFSFVIGADKLPSLPYWYESKKLFSLCDFLCIPRSGVHTEESLLKARQAGARIQMVSMFNVPYSSTMIRLQTKDYQDAEGLNRNVERYMAERGLYQKNILPKLQGMMNPRRFQHTLGVRKEAVRLADIHRVPIQKSALAALLHDCAKGMPVKEMSKIAEKYHLMPDENMLTSGAMMHGPVGAYLAQTEFGVKDEDILNAIRNHTIGRPGMTKFEMCLFVADATEENREDYEGLSQLRYLSDRSLPAAVYRSIQLTQEYLEKNHRPFYPIVHETMDYLSGILTPDEKRLLSQNI